MIEALLHNELLFLEPYVTNCSSLLYRSNYEWIFSYITYFQQYFHVYSKVILHIGHYEILQRNVRDRLFSKNSMNFFSFHRFLEKRKYSTAANGLQQRVINLFYRIVNDSSKKYSWSTQYGALIGLCEMNNKVNWLLFEIMDF